MEAKKYDEAEATTAALEAQVAELEQRNNHREKDDASDGRS